MITHRGPWALWSLHIPTGKRTASVVKLGHPYATGKCVAGYVDFLEMIAWCNEQQPGVWQYWKGNYGV